jgi:hypothetical protein
MDMSKMLSEHQIANGVRQSAAVSYIDSVLHRTNLDILVNTHVTKLVQTGNLLGVPIFRGVQFAQPGSCKTSYEYVLDVSLTQPYF